MLSTHEAWIAEQRDRSRIERTLRRYFEGHDTGNLALARSALTPNGKLFVDDVQRTGPGAAPIEQIGQPRGLPRTEKILGFTHCMHQFEIVLDGDRACGEVYATAYLIIDVGAGRRVLVRGLRYFDRYARVGDEWLIEERRLNVHWMFEAPAAFATPLPERQSFAAFLAANGIQKDAKL